MESEQLKSKEQWLREELRAARTLLQTQMQWGITVLAAVGLNLYYIRKDAKAHLVEQMVLAAQELLPFSRWFIGTVFLLILASVFASTTRRVALHHQFYRTQLRDMNPSYSGIREDIPVATNRFLNNSPYLLFFAIPALDLVIWTLFYAGEKLQISFLIPW
jgi:uncharacterized protein YggT (Ycf19 family)